MAIESNFKKLYWMNLFLHTFFLTPIVTLFYLHRGLSFSEIFIIGAVFGIGRLIFEIPTGVIADKIGRKNSIIIGILLYIIHHVLFLFAYGLTQFIFAFLVFVIGYTFLSGTVEAFIYDCLKHVKRPNDMKKEFGKYSSASRVPAFILPIIGAIIARNLLEWQFKVVIGLTLVFTIVAFFLTLTLVEPQSSKKNRPKSRELIKQSVNLFKGNISFRRIFWNSTLVYIPFMVFWRIWQPYLTNVGLPVIALGVVVSTHNLLTFFLERNIHWIEQRIGMERAIFLTTVFPTIGFILLIAFKNVITALLGIYLIFVFSVSRRPLISDYLNSHIESKNRATALSLLNMLKGLFDLLIIGGTAWATVYYDFIGLYIAGALVLIGFLFFRLKKHHIAKTRA